MSTPGGRPPLNQDRPANAVDPNPPRQWGAQQPAPRVVGSVGGSKCTVDPLPDACRTGGVSRTRALIDNLPYAIMILCGAAVFWIGPGGSAWRWATAVVYAVYGVVGAFWIMFFVCPYCHFYDTRLCPCGYGRIAARLRPRQETGQFARQFRQHIPVIVPLWFLPLIVAGIGLAREFTWFLLGLAIAFAVNSFLVLPLVSRKYGCKTCPQKDGCPWMGPPAAAPTT